MTSLRHVRYRVNVVSYGVVFKVNGQDEALISGLFTSHVALTQTPRISDAHAARHLERVPGDIRR